MIDGSRNVALSGVATDGKVLSWADAHPRTYWSEEFWNSTRPEFESEGVSEP